MASRAAGQWAILPMLVPASEPESTSASHTQWEHNLPDPVTVPVIVRRACRTDVTHRTDQRVGASVQYGSPRCGRIYLLTWPAAMRIVAAT